MQALCNQCRMPSRGSLCPACGWEDGEIVDDPFVDPFDLSPAECEILLEIVAENRRGRSVRRGDMPR